VLAYIILFLILALSGDLCSSSRSLLHLLCKEPQAPYKHCFSSGMQRAVRSKR
jgi:hypothetical protein